MNRTSAAARPDTPFLERLDRDVEERLFLTGYQLYVSIAGESVVDTANGVDALERSVGRDNLFAVYCTGKPVLATLVAEAVDAGVLSYCDRVGDHLDHVRPQPTRALTLGQLLDHTAGLAGRGVQAGLLPTHQRRRAAALTEPAPGHRVGSDQHYSEFAAWYLLGAIYESATGSFISHAVPELCRRRHVPAGELLVCPTLEDAQRAAEKTAINVDLHGDRFVPMLSEAIPDVIAEWNPAFGARATARALGALLESLLEERATRPDSAVGAIGVPTHHPVADRALGRVCTFGRGVMSVLSDHDFGPACSATSFGHSGNAGMSFAFADPECGLVAAYIGNGYCDPQTLVGYSRGALVASLYAELGLATRSNGSPLRQEAAE